MRPLRAVQCFMETLNGSKLLFHRVFEPKKVVATFFENAQSGARVKGAFNWPRKFGGIGASMPMSAGGRRGGLM